ncbi:hypothetical protein BJ875DRAFT_382037, partial [Amylocarpus encephaloides]
IINNVVRDDPTKRSIHNREQITLKLLWKSMCDDLWLLHIISLTFQILETTPTQ